MRNLFFNLGRGKGDKDKDRDPAAESTAFLTGDDRIDAPKIRSLLETMAALIADVKLDHLLTSVVDRSIELVAAERGLLFLYDDAGHLQVEVARDAHGADLPQPVQYSTTVASRAEQGTPMCLKVGESDKAMDLSQSVVDLKLRAVMCVRLQFKEETLGVIYVDSKASAREFTRADLRFFEALASSLSIAIANARLVSAAIERERLKQSLSIAKRIQSALLPENPDNLPGWDVIGWSIPAEEALGDYYDFIHLPGNRLGIAVGDVCGHGVGPALLMSSARSLLRAYTAMGLSVGEVLGRINNQLTEDLEEGMFMSLFYGIIDLDARTLTYANAGQTPPAHLPAGRDTFENFTSTGPALGIEPEIAYEEVGPCELGTGDVLALFTDGIIELKSPQDEVYGRKRLCEVIRASRNEGSRATLDAVRQDVRRYVGSGEVDDDMTFVLVHVGHRP